MKKVSKLLLIVFVFSLVFSIPTLAADYTTVNLEGFGDRQEALNEAKEEGVSSFMFGPAPPVTEVRIIWAGIVNGRVEIDVRIMGYGNRVTNVTGGLAQPVLINTFFIGHTPVVGFIETYDLGPAIVGGPYQFSISSRSHNMPWNTMSDSFVFTIS